MSYPKMALGSQDKIEQLVLKPLHPFPSFLQRTEDSSPPSIGGFRIGKVLYGLSSSRRNNLCLISPLVLGWLLVVKKRRCESRL